MFVCSLGGATGWGFGIGFGIGIGIGIGCCLGEEDTVRKDDTGGVGLVCEEWWWWWLWVESYQCLCLNSLIFLWSSQMNNPIRIALFICFYMNTLEALLSVKVHSFFVICAFHTQLHCYFLSQRFRTTPSYLNRLPLLV